MKSATLDEVIHSLKEEKENEVGCRFPCRVILLHSRESYISCVNALKQICDKTISADELFSGADVMPGYDTLLSKVDSDKWMLLPGVSEYLRLFSTSERRSGRFAKLWRKAIDASTKGRILIPLWNCDTLWFDKALEFALDERQDDYVWSISDDEPSIPEKLYIKILSSDFEAYINQLNEKYSMIIGLRDWYSGMVENSKLPNDYCLLTKQARSVENSVGNITINVTKDAFSFVSANLNGGQSLKRDELSDAALNELFDEALKNTSVNQAILNRFNMSQFDANLMISGWDNMPDGKRELVRLWYRLNPDNSYLCHCFEVSELCDVEKHIMLDIFDLLNPHQEWIKEYCELSNRLKLKKDDVFFKKLDGIPLYSDRLLFLSSNTREERIYLIRLHAQCMRNEFLQTGEEGIKNEYRRIFSTVTDLIDIEMLPGLMSLYSYKLATKANLKNINEVRCRNAQVLINELRGFKFIQPQSGLGDLYAAILIENRDAVQRMLASMGIFCTIIWPLNDEQRLVCEIARYTEDHVLAVYCDQRYTIEDMKYIAFCIRRVCNG